ncbi:hypothetical protein K3495_g958 [Podosphaera aphanis]|nr:hypothetical protein K3495_g958 [Podosphaera aphanis]
MTETSAKRLKVSPLTIATHNGHFHADEALAVFMLRLVPKYQDSQLVRSRDPTVLATCHTVVDVGGKYEPDNNLFDHHQRGFLTTFPNRPTKLSSAGLVYLHFGKTIIAQKLGVSEESTGVQLIWEKIYESFIEALDANDNGISVYDSAALAAAGIEKRFKDGGFTLASMVSRLNLKWNDPSKSDPTEAQTVEDERFSIASNRIGEEFNRALEFYTEAWLPARDIVKEAYSQRFQYEPQGRLLVFEGLTPPWTDHLFTIEDELNTLPNVLYVLYPEKATPDAKWRIQCVPQSPGSFASRKPLPEGWRGLRDEELDTKTGISGGIFVHAAGFIGGNKTFTGAMQMALKALEIGS